ncbi:MAG TPA: hypothetical protein VHK69_15490, partial [Chitinophagaceae bacterium]|nr:hypothetical protein [Chitinophagaceae bacterium]
LAFAGRFPERTKQVTILCGFTRRFDAEVMAAMTLNKWYFRAARYVPFLLRWALRQMRNRTFRSMLPRWLTGLPRSDYKLIAQIPALNGLVRATVRESVRLETRGAVHEARLYFGVLPFALSAIRVPVRYWWGTEDNTVIHLHAAAAEQEIPGAAVRYRAGEGHLSLYVHCMAEALRELSGPPERSGTGNAWPEN